MTARQVIDMFKDNVPYTIGTAYGDGWHVYYDGCGNKMVSSRHDNPSELLDRYIVEIYAREGRDAYSNCIDLKDGLAIIVHGKENGRI